MVLKFRTQRSECEVRAFVIRNGTEQIQSSKLSQVHIQCNKQRCDFNHTHSLTSIHYSALSYSKYQFSTKKPSLLEMSPLQGESSALQPGWKLAHLVNLNTKRQVKYQVREKRRPFRKYILATVQRQIFARSKFSRFYVTYDQNVKIRTVKYEAIRNQENLNT